MNFVIKTLNGHIKYRTKRQSCQNFLVLIEMEKIRKVNGGCSFFLLILKKEITSFLIVRRKVNSFEEVLFDLEAQESRKKIKPKHNACEVAMPWVPIYLTEEEYRKLPRSRKIWSKTSSLDLNPIPIETRRGSFLADFNDTNMFFGYSQWRPDSIMPQEDLGRSLRVWFLR